MSEENNFPSHNFVPIHTKLTSEEKEQLLKELNTTIKKLPKILASDPAIVTLQPQEGEIIKIERNSNTIGRSIFYRRVING